MQESLPICIISASKTWSPKLICTMNCWIFWRLLKMQWTQIFLLLKIKCNFSHLITAKGNLEDAAAKVEVVMEVDTLHSAKSVANLDTVPKTARNASTRTSMDGKICRTTLSQLHKLTISAWIHRQLPQLIQLGILIVTRHTTLPMNPRHSWIRLYTKGQINCSLEMAQVCPYIQLDLPP